MKITRKYRSLHSKRVEKIKLSQKRSDLRRSQKYLLKTSEKKKLGLCEGVDSPSIISFISFSTSSVVSLSPPPVQYISKMPSSLFNTLSQILSTSGDIHVAATSMPTSPDLRNYTRSECRFQLGFFRSSVTTISTRFECSFTRATDPNE